MIDWKVWTVWTLVACVMVYGLWAEFAPSNVGSAPLVNHAQLVDDDCEPGAEILPAGPAEKEQRFCDPPLRRAPTLESRFEFMQAQRVRSIGVHGGDVWLSIVRDKKTGQEFLLHDARIGIVPLPATEPEKSSVLLPAKAQD
jgi:hypothetical protein